MRRLALFSIVLFLIISGCATTKPRLTDRQLQDMGEKYLQTGDTATALKFLTEVEQKRPNDPEIQYDLGLAYNQRGIKDKAISHLQKALQLNPGFSEAQNAIGTMYAERGQVELAQEAFLKALNDPFYRTPQLPAYNLGRLYEKKGDIERALTYYQQAVKFDLQYGAAWYRIGQILEQLRRGDEARHAYGKAVSASPDLAEANLRYGVMSYLAGDMEAAIYSLSRVGKIAPNSSMADEARMYLDKLRGAAQTIPHSKKTPASLPGEFEVISNAELQSQQTKTASPSESPLQLAPVIRDDSEKLQSAPTKVENVKISPPVKKAPDSPNTAAASQGPAAEGPQLQSYNYIVQVGSFVDEQKAQEMKKNLQEKGYKTIVKPLKHQVLGKVFVLQLQPVSSESKATTLMTQLGTEVEGEPVIIKVPVK